jgi:FAD/FMN-containing dehydrogenase/Fe-S oxidoreductase
MRAQLPKYNASLINEFDNTLRRSIRGDVRFDHATRILYSTDASIYQIEPIGVAFPMTPDELVACVEAANMFKIPILPRGSGTSLAGQAIGPALILDCSRYLQGLIKINPEQMIAIVEPGVVISTLNKKAAKFGLEFGPDPASAERATIGGSLANNAAGAHSIRYGMCADHFLSGEIILSDGSTAHFGSISIEEAHRKAGSNIREGMIYRAVLAIRERHAAEIRANWPKTWRRASGYNLNYLLPWSPSQPPQWAQLSQALSESILGNHGFGYPPIQDGMVNLAPIIAGSEGTLGIISQATLRLVPLQKHTVLVLLAFPDILAACDQIPTLLSREPSAIELIPSNLIKLARNVPAYARKLSFIDQLCSAAGDVPTLLAVEFSGEDQDEIEGKAHHLISFISSPSLAAFSREEQDQVWDVRKAGLGLLMSMPGDLKPISFIEDLSVPIENLTYFISEMQKILDENGTEGDFYAHASAGCLHMRPLLNPKSIDFSRQLKAIAQEAVDLVIRLGGSVSGEHGDGIARSDWLEKMYGSEIVAAFRELKGAADPGCLLNPGKIVDPLPMDENFRYVSAQPDSSWLPVMSFQTQAGAWRMIGPQLEAMPGAGMLSAVEMCNGAGVCRKNDGVMCPSFQVTREEMHCTRGRANLLRALFTGRLSATNPADLATIYQALDLCLACKGCKSECPSAVDMAKLKYEFLANYYDRKGNRRPLRDYLFAFLDRSARIGMKFQPFSNLVIRILNQSSPSKRWLGLSTCRKIPRLSAISLRQHVETHRQELAANHPLRSNVIFLSDPFTEYFQPEVGLAALRVISLAGYNAILLPVIGAGRTLISKGFLNAARKHAQRVLEAVNGIDPEGKMCIVGVEPSEIYSLGDEYFDFFPGDARVKALASRSFMIDEFLVRPDEDRPDKFLRIVEFREQAGLKSGKILLHGHCYQKSQPPRADGYPIGVEATQKMLERVGYSVQVIDSGCCGMAGAFGYEADHYELSIKIGELSLFPEIRFSDPQAIICAAGFSCIAQIKDGAGRTAIHPISLLYPSGIALS